MKSRQTSHVVVISPYAVHRNPLYWDDAMSFLPERWAGRVERRAWMPFGAGSQSCIAASLSVDVVSELLAALFRKPASIEFTDTRPSVGPALAPARFTLLRA